MFFPPFQSLILLFYVGRGPFSAPSCFLFPLLVAFGLTRIQNQPAPSCRCVSDMAYNYDLWKAKPGSTGSSWSKKSTYTPPPEPPLGSLLSTIKKKDLVAKSEEYIPSAKITDCEYVASFNWRNSRAPSAFVPGRTCLRSSSSSSYVGGTATTPSFRGPCKLTGVGKPPRWTPVSEFKRLPLDKSEYPLDRNGYHFPKHPFEATALSVLFAQPEPPKTIFDIICSSRSLGYLISFCVNNDFREFRSLVEVVGGVVHILKRDNAPDELLSGVKGYGHTFPEANTTWDVETAGSTSHQRVVKYTLGGLKILLRGEIDGYLPELTPAGNSSRGKVSLDELVNGLKSSSLSPQIIDGDTSTITVKEAGSPVPQSSLFDLKTRSELRRGEDILGQQLPRLWRSQIPNFILAFHERGTFRDTTVRNVQNQIDEWEKENAKGIAVLVTLLRRFVDIVTTNPGQKMEIRATVDSEIEVREQLPDAGDLLSPSVREKWERWLQKAPGGSATAPALGHESQKGSQYSSGDEDFWFEYHSDSEEPDFTACAVDSCGYCGKCSY